MSYLAICSVREKSGSVGIRLFDPDKVTFRDIPLSDVNYYLQRNGGIRNISIDKKGKIQWKQGTADRYPILDNMTGELRNENSVVVINVADTGTQKFYQICNYMGAITTISDRQLIDYGKRYKLANCKIVKKQGKEFIQSIEGQLPEIDTKPTFIFRRDRGYMEVNIPFITSSEFEIKEMTPDGALITDLKSLNIKPMSSALAIKKLVLHKNVKHINSGIFISMPNLEEIIIKAKDALIYNNAFMGLKRLRYVYIEGVKASGMSIFEGVESLEKVDFGKPLQYINSSAFKGCINLDISSVLIEGVQEIGTKAFYRNKKLVHLVIPKSVNTVSYNAFERCSELKDIDCRTDLLNIQSNYSRQADKKFLEGLQPIEFYCSKNIVMQGEVGPNVKIIYKEPTEKDHAIEKKKLKASMLGLRVGTDRLLAQSGEIAEALLAAPQQEVTDMMQDLVNKALNALDERMHEYNPSGIYDIGGYKVHMGLITSGTGIASAKKVKNIGKFIALMGNTIIFVPCDQTLLKEYFGRYGNRMEFMVRAVSETAKYLKSVDISDNGLIRLIYKNKAGHVSQKEIKDYMIPD